MAKSSRSSIFHLENISIFLGELFGTFLLVFLGCSSCLAWNGSNNVDPLRNVLSFGFAVLICVQIFGCVSGAHINPAVTVAAVIYKLISVQMGIVYLIAQCLGAFMGYGVLLSLTPTSIVEASGRSFCVTKPHDLLQTWQAFCIEFIATATFIWFCCSIWDPRNAKLKDSISLRFGLAVSGIASATAHYTGGSFNPARSLGPAIWENHFDSHWVYWLAPISGAIVASSIYKYVFHRDVIDDEDHGQQLETLGD